ncbi:MAG TPA: dihydroorotate dehydrogenase-like protein [Magnetospirillaceae bacterium]|nr:dihydroorotate dehydrogenase-like protein [Magnetospirillaceae bacterium]
MNLATRYMGLYLSSPLIASASPLTRGLDNILRIADAGAGAVVLPSLFQEQIEASTRRKGAALAATDDFPEGHRSHASPKTYLSLVEKASVAVSIPIIGSLNGTTNEGWIVYAHQIEQAGAAGLELNIYSIPTDIEVSGAEIERRYVEIVRAVTEEVKIPVAVKLGPYFSALGHLARQLDDNGAAALVLFNRFYQPDVDIGTMQLVNDLRLSDRHELRLPMLWISVLAGRVRASLAASSGVETAEEVIKYLLAGADAVMTTSALLRFGPSHLGTLRDGLVSGMEAHGVDDIGAMRGTFSRLQLGRCSPLFERSNYVDILGGYES